MTNGSRLRALPLSATIAAALAAVFAGGSIAASPAAATAPCHTEAAGGVAICGNVTGSQILVRPEVGRDLVAASARQWRGLTEQQRAELDRLQRELGVSQGALQTFFAILGEHDVTPDRYGEKLGEIAGRYRDLQQQLAASPAGSPAIAALKAQAQAALKAGRLDDADRLLAQIGEAQDAALQGQLADRAATATSRGDLAMTQLRYKDAAQRYAEAARFAPDEKARLAAGDAEANAFYQQGDEFGDNAALAAAIEHYGDLLSLRPRERVPLDWAATQMNLGNALGSLGERESGTASLEEAVAAYSAALEEYTRERSPLDWAHSVLSLCNTRRLLSERAGDLAALTAIEAEAAEARAVVVQAGDAPLIAWGDYVLAKIGEARRELGQ